MKTEERRTVLLTGARLTAVAALGAIAAALVLRGKTKDSKVAGYCDRAGRCGDCEVTKSCDVYQDMHGGPRP